MLRAPEEQFVSHINFILNNSKNQVLRDRIDRNDIAGSIRGSKILRNVFLNSQCRFVGGNANAAAAIRFIRENDVAIFDISRIDDLTNLVAAKYGVPIVQSPRRKAGLPDYAEQFETDDLNDLLERENSEDRILYRWLSDQGGSYVSDEWKIGASLDRI